MANTRISPTEDRAVSKKISAMAQLWPFVTPYKGMVALALVALTFTAMISLVMPLAARQVVDNFDVSDGSVLDSYIGLAFVVAALLAIGTALRYYLVTRLGERIVADIRVAVFDRMIGMSPAFFENVMTGEVLSRITTDTTLILSVIGSSVSVALRNVLILFGGIGLMLWTSVKMTGLVLWPIPVILIPIVFLGRRVQTLSRENQDWIAASSGDASEQLLWHKQSKHLPMKTYLVKSFMA